MNGETKTQSSKVTALYFSAGQQQNQTQKLCFPSPVCQIYVYKFVGGEHYV